MGIIKVDLKELEGIKTIDGVTLSKEWAEEIINRVWHIELKKENSNNIAEYSSTISNELQDSLEGTFKQEDINKLVKLAIREWELSLDDPFEWEEITMKNYDDFTEEEKTKLIDKKIKCVELVTNDTNEYGLNTYVIAENENGKELVKELNKKNTDKKVKWIYVEYTVQKDLSLMCI